MRIAVHGQKEFPFPDTFGFSAPTGFISSFGISLTTVSRLPAPYGTCEAERDRNKTAFLYKVPPYFLSSSEARELSDLLVLSRCRLS